MSDVEGVPGADIATPPLPAKRRGELESSSSNISVQEHKRSWNTRNLGLRLGSDVAAAASAGALVAPIITVIDRSIIENASGRAPLISSIKSSLQDALLRPHRFVFCKPFGLIYLLYFGTYLTSNALDTVSSTLTPSSASTTTSGAPKFIATSTANLSLCLYKDQAFTKLFGASTSSPRPIPKASYALFALRDCLTIFASFNVPPLLAPLLPLSHSVEETVSRASIAQFIAPAAVQLVSTPLHLLGLDLYNRPAGEKVNWTSRLSKVRKDWLVSCAARVGRIVPAFGMGGVVNAGVRARLMGRLEQ
ncbi:MAG: hypothetical protein M1819_003172 [Sarea resinae]|nr:MAG: hypothetical protein M1819_003172 [Sarea resinae]